MHKHVEDGESTEKWAIRQPGFMGTLKQLTCCARCGAALGGVTKKHKVFNLMKPGMHFLCDPCFGELPD